MKDIDLVYFSPTGNTRKTLQTIAAGANAITFTPPSTQELFKEMMERYRE